MTEKSGELVQLEGDETNASSLLPAAPQAFQPGWIWNFVDSCWNYPDWHGGWFRQIGLIFFKKKGRKESPQIQAARSLSELRALFVAIIGYGHLYREDILGTHNGYKNFNIGVQTLFSVNQRSLNIHDRISLIPSLAGYVESHCVVCSMFSAFRSLVLTRALDSTCGTPSEWEALIAEGGDNAFLALLQRFEAASAGRNIGMIHADDFHRFPAFVTGLMKISIPVETVAVVSQPATPAPQISEPEPKNEKPEAPNVSFNVSVCTPVNVIQKSESTARSEANPTNTNNNQANVEHLEEAADTPPESPLAQSDSVPQDEPPEPQGQAKPDEKSTAGSTTPDPTPPQTENAQSAESHKGAADATDQAAEQLPQAATENNAAEQTDAATQDDAGDADDAPVPNEKTRKPRGRTKFQTSQSLQYTVLCILCDLHKDNREASLTADELAAEVRRKDKTLRIDKTDCYRIINDLKLVLSNVRSEWQISTGEYRLISPPYGRADKLKAQFEHLKK